MLLKAQEMKDSAKKEEKLKVLLTGFSHNASEVLVTEFKKSNTIDLDVDTFIFKPRYKSISKNLEKLLSNCNYDLVILTGLKSKAQNLTLEPIARNAIYKKGGVIKIDQESFETLTSNLNIAYITSKVNFTFSIESIESIGLVFCNYLYFKALSYIIRYNLDTKVIFIHIPNFDNLDLTLQLKSLSSFIEAVIPVVKENGN